ncbi:hypothetical protein V8E54_007943 [Elaphomyces granulatus]
MIGEIWKSEEIYYYAKLSHQKRADKARLRQLAKDNHYFREKKWEFFPELAPLSISQLSTTTVVQPCTPKPKARKCREPSSKHPKSDMTSICAGIQKAFSEKTSKLQKSVRQCTDTESRPISRDTLDKGTPSVIEGAPLQHDPAEVCDRMRALSLLPYSDVGENDIVSYTPPPRKQHLVPVTPDQKDNDSREGIEIQRRLTQRNSQKGRPSKGNTKRTRPE